MGYPPVSKTRKFLLTYDEEYDADIDQVLQHTPVKRRSERIRSLLRLGLAAERQGLFAGARPPAVSDGPQDTEKGTRKPVRFSPPSS